MEDGHLQCWKHICSGVYANYVKYMYTGVPGHIADCRDFPGDMHSDVSVSYLHMN